MASQDETGRCSTLEPLLNALASAFTNAKYSDLTVKCGDRQWPVHRVIVCSQSSFFDGACGRSFKEAHENVVTLEDDQPAAVEAMLQFLYTGDYSDGNLDLSRDDPSALVVHAFVHILAHKYDLLALGTLAGKKFDTLASKVWGEAAFANAIGIA